MADSKPKIVIVPAAQDVAPSNEYPTLEHLMRESRIQGWTLAKTGRKMIKHFGWLMNVAKRNQNNECNICDKVLDNVQDIGQRQGYVTHRRCAGFSGSIGRQIERSLKAYGLSKYPSYPSDPS